MSLGVVDGDAAAGDDPRARQEVDVVGADGVVVGYGELGSGGDARGDAGGYEGYGDGYGDDELLVEDADLQPPPPRPPFLAPTTRAGLVVRVLWIVGGVLGLVGAHALVGAFVGGGLAGFGDGPAHDGVTTGVTVGVVLGLLAAADWLWRRSRHASFEVLRGPDGVARWAGDPAGAGVGWWSAWVAVGGPLLLLVTGATALWEVVRWGDPGAGQLLRRGFLALVVACGLLGGGGWALGREWGGGEIEGAVAGGVLGVVLVGLPWALPAARRYATPWFPMHRLAPALEVRVARANGEDVREPRHPGLAWRAAGVLTVLALLAVPVVAAVGWIAGAEEEEVAAVEPEAPVVEQPATTTTPTTAPYPPLAGAGVVDEAVVAQGTYRLEDPLAGFGLWCHVIAVYPAEAVTVDPAALVLIDPEGGWHAPLAGDVGSPRASRVAGEVAAGAEGRFEACFELPAGAVPGQWGLVGLPGGEEAALFATLDAADAPPPTTTTTVVRTTTTAVPEETTPTEPTPTTAAATQAPPASSDPPAV